MALETKRIILRTPIPEDDVATLSYYTDPVTMHHLPILYNQPWDAARIAARREGRAQDESKGRARNFTILLRNQGEEECKVIGQAGYSTIWAEEPLKRGELGILLADAYQRMGFVWDVHLLLLAFGFDELGLEKIEWVTAEGNDGMRAVLRRMDCKESEAFLDPEWGVQVKYILDKEQWSDLKIRLRERVDRLALRKEAESLPRITDLTTS